MKAFHEIGDDLNSNVYVVFMCFLFHGYIILHNLC